MLAITQDYLDQLAPIYHDVLAAFIEFDPARRPGDMLAFQSLASVLDDKYTLGEVRAACQELAKGGAITIEHGIFAKPTELGESLIERITGRKPASFPPFSPPASPE